MRRLVYISTGVLLVLLAGCSSPSGSRANSQHTNDALIRIVGAPDCDECRLEMTRELTLRDQPDVGRQVVGGNQAVVRNAAGETFLVHGMNGSQIQVFDATGTFVRSVGSQGQGPGEFSYIFALALDDG